MNLEHKTKLNSEVTHTLKILPSDLCEEETSSLNDTSRFDGQAIKADISGSFFYRPEVINSTETFTAGVPWRDSGDECNLPSDLCEKENIIFPKENSGSNGQQYHNRVYQSCVLFARNYATRLKCHLTVGVPWRDSIGIRKG